MSRRSTVNGVRSRECFARNHTLKTDRVNKTDFLGTTGVVAPEIETEIFAARPNSISDLTTPPTKNDSITTRSLKHGLGGVRTEGAARSSEMPALGLLYYISPHVGAVGLESGARGY